MTRSGALDHSFCQHVIQKFNLDTNVTDDRTFGGVKQEVQKRKSLGISMMDEWKEEDRVFHESLNTVLQDYVMLGSTGIYKDLGYKIARQGSDGYYHWHHDAHWEEDWCRVLSFLWYLNTLKDGYTEFFEGTKVYPEAGKIILFPASNIFLHRSTKTETEKFICTGWLYEKSYKMKI